MTLVFASVCLLIGAALILLCDGLALRKKGYLNKSEIVGLVTGIVFGAIGAITFFLGNDFVIPFVWRGVIIAVGTGIVLLSVFGLPRIRRQSEIETPRNRAAIQKQRPSLTYGRINVRRTSEKEHGGTYQYSLYLLEISNVTPNTEAINCQGFLDLHNNPEIRDHIALWNKNSSDKISIGHREFLRLYTISKFYIGNRRVDTKLLFDKKSNIDGAFEYWNVPYIESMNRELYVLLQSENASYPPAAEAFTKTIQYIIDNAIEE